MKSWNASIALHSPATVFCLFETLFVSRYSPKLMHQEGFVSSTTGVKLLPQPDTGVAYQLSPQTHLPRDMRQNVQLHPCV